MERPEFDNIKTYEEFSKYYWYRNELIAICREHSLNAPSGKIELNKVIESWFNGEKILPEKKKGRKKKFNGELTLDTGLIECGFNCSNKFREFFAREIGVEKFKFKVDMVASAKAVKENGDENFTLRDLLDIYYGKKTYAIYDKSALQWNRFVHDFCDDKATMIYKNKMKAAAVLWNIIRNSEREKKYSHELLDEFSQYMKNLD